VASASVPGFFPPVLIHVHEGARAYDELHADGGVTTSVFAFPLVANLALQDIPPLHGGSLYMIVNGQLAHLPDTTPVTTLAVLRKSFSAALTYNTRETILDTMTLADRLVMHFRLTEIPVGYPVKSSVDFDPRYMRQLFDYGQRCAAAGLLWLTPEQATRLNMNAHREADGAQPACPGPVDAALHPPVRVGGPP
jgi:predicted acylesterase/phospholipase RssA